MGFILARIVCDPTRSSYLSHCLIFRRPLKFPSLFIGIPYLPQFSLPLSSSTLRAKFKPHYNSPIWNISLGRSLLSFVYILYLLLPHLTLYQLTTLSSLLHLIRICNNCTHYRFFAAGARSTSSLCRRWYQYVFRPYISHA